MSALSVLMMFCDKSFDEFLDLNCILIFVAVLIMILLLLENHVMLVVTFGFVVQLSLVFLSMSENMDVFRLILKQSLFDIIDSHISVRMKST